MGSSLLVDGGFGSRANRAHVHQRSDDVAAHQLLRLTLTCDWPVVSTVETTDPHIPPGAVVPEEGAGYGGRIKAGASLVAVFGLALSSRRKKEAFRVRRMSKRKVVSVHLILDHACLSSRAYIGFRGSRAGQS